MFSEQSGKGKIHIHNIVIYYSYILIFFIMSFNSLFFVYRIESIFGLYVISGRSIYTMTELDDTMDFISNFRNIDYKVTINAESKRHFSGKTLQTSKMEDHNVIFNLINIVIK